MNPYFTALIVFQLFLSGLITLSWLLNGALTPWGILVYVMTALELGVYFHALSKRVKK